MLLLIKPPRIEVVRHAHHTKLICRHPSLPRLTQRKCNQLRYIRADGNGWLTNTEQLVDEGEKDAQQYANKPSAHGRTGRGRVIFVVDDGADLGVRAVVGDEGGLELHLDDEGFVLLGVAEDVIVGKEVLDPLDDDVREVGIALMNAEDIGHELGMC